MYYFLIIGAGFSRSVLAQSIANETNETVLIIDKRNNLAGNCFDYYNEHGILIHKYGQYWLFTDDKPLGDYLSKFTERDYHLHRVKASVERSLVPIPINVDTAKGLYGLNLSSPTKVQIYFDGIKTDTKKPYKC